MEIITLTREQYQADIRTAALIVAEEILRGIKKKEELAVEDLVCTKEAQVLAGYKQHHFFKAYCRRNGITPYRREGNTKLYKRSDFQRRHSFN